MTMNLHSDNRPKASQATSVSPLEQSGSLKTKFSRAKQSPCWRSQNRPLPDGNGQHHCSPESGVKPWCVRGFATAQRWDYRPTSTGTTYSGINIMLLWCSAAKQGFQDERWLTYKQAQELGGRGS